MPVDPSICRAWTRCGCDPAPGLERLAVDRRGGVRPRSNLMTKVDDQSRSCFGDEPAPSDQNRRISRQFREVEPAVDRTGNLLLAKRAVRSRLDRRKHRWLRGSRGVGPVVAVSGIRSGSLRFAPSAGTGARLAALMYGGPCNAGCQRRSGRTSRTVYVATRGASVRKPRGHARSRGAIRLGVATSGRVARSPCGIGVVGRV